MQNRRHDNRGRSKDQGGIETIAFQTHVSNITSINCDSVITRTFDPQRMTQNKATFVQNGPEPSISPMNVGYQTQKPNGQALYMNSRPKIRQFFQNLSSSNTSLAELQSTKRRLSCENYPRSSAANASQLAPNSRPQISNARSHDRAK